MSSLGSASSSADAMKEGSWEKISYVWRIEDVDSRLKGRKIRTLTSPVFYSKNRDWRWQMKLETRSSKDMPESSRYVNMYLRLISMPNDLLQAKFTLSLRNSTDRIIRIKSDETSFTKGRASGFSKVIRFADLLPWIPDKILKVYAEVWVEVQNSETKDRFFTPRCSEVAGKRLQKSMDGPFRPSEFTDVVFEVEDEKLPAHQCILSARSSVFAAMFAHESIEKNSAVVKIVDFEKGSFALFLRFVYSGKVDIPSVNAAMDLFRAGDKYDFQDLKLLCKNYMSTNLNSSNVGQVLLMAESFGAGDLKQAAMDYMLKNIEVFCDAKKEVYKQFEKENPKLLTEFLVTGIQTFLEKINSESSRNRR